jgi:hypothetical protein
LHSAAVYLALVALMLRGLVPVGWMPDAAAPAHTTLIPCPMMEGMHGMAMPMPEKTAQHPAKHPLPASHEGSICPFATAAQPVRAAAPHQIEIAPSQFALISRAASALAATWDHIPRAPPLAA